VITAYIGTDGVTYHWLQAPRTIEITRVEGPVELCGRPYVCGSWSEAHAFLSLMSRTAPEHGGYDKHDFQITWPNGFKYAGRYDLMHWRKEQPNLAGHVRSFLTYLAEDSDEHVSQKEADAAIELLKTIDVYQSPVPVEEGVPHHIAQDFRKSSPLKGAAA